MPNTIKRLPRNPSPTGRDVIVGDIHGHLRKLQATLDAAGFDPARGDRLVSVGDLVDRGPDSDEALAWLAKPWFHAVRGNHEEMAIDWDRGDMSAGMYLMNGGAWNVANPPELVRDIAEAFLALPLAIEIETAAGLVGVVHADCPYPDWVRFARTLSHPRSEMELNHAVAMALWSRDRADSGNSRPVEGLRALVVGHTPHREVRRLGNVIYADTYGWRDGAFTLLDAATLEPLVV